LDEVVISIAGKKHWLWRAVDQAGFVLDVLVQSLRDKNAAKRLFRKLLKKQGRAPRVLVTDKLKSYTAAKREIMPQGSSIANTRASITEPKIPINRPDARERIMKVESRMGAVAWAIRHHPVSHPRSSNRTCGTIASGSLPSRQSFALGRSVSRIGTA
jgi:putative transposase